MSSLTDLVRTIFLDQEETPEDIFASAPGLIFTDDLRNQHGDPGAVIVYKSSKYGDIELQAADPSGEEERRLFSHYLWNAGVLMSERISGQRLLDDTERRQWSIEGNSVIELGAGVGLSSIVATLAGAQEVYSTDYPAQVVLDNLRRNIKSNVPQDAQHKITVAGHEWGVLDDDDFASRYAHHFTHVLAADCFWMPQVHLELVQSMLHFLSSDPDARVFAIAGFHTGRVKLAGFFDMAVQEGLEIEDIVEEDARGVRRSWDPHRDGGREDHTERRKWLVIAVLKRASVHDT